MKLEEKLKLKNIIIDDVTLRYCQIYKITNIKTGKVYIGQSVSHILNHKRYRPYGYEGRFRCHISEAFSEKKNQSHFLNNSIRKHGFENFKVELIENCECTEADKREKYNISKFNSLYPNGYNLKNGGMSFEHTNESKLRVSRGVKKYFIDKKLKRFKDVEINDLNYDKYIRPLNRNKNQYGWYVYIEGKKADFGGVHIDLETSYEEAKNFLKKIYNKEYQQETLMRETP